MKSTETENPDIANFIMFALLAAVAIFVLNPMLAVGWDYIVEIFKSAFDTMGPPGPVSPFSTLAP
ncbi:MAG: hypothetical protein U1D30_20120 [Planctomycetota bacterium]